MQEAGLRSRDASLRLFRVAQQNQGAKRKLELRALSLMADLSSSFVKVASKLKVVLLPRENQEGVLQKLKDWDLWGPLLVCLTLSLVLSTWAPDGQKPLVFASVFFIVWVGAAVVTLNAQLLVREGCHRAARPRRHVCRLTRAFAVLQGGTISFFQSVCILGYCVFPLTVAAIVCFLFKLMGLGIMPVRMVVVVVGFIWATRASVVFIAKIIAEERKVLAVYPVFFFYTFISWMILLQS